MPEFVSIGGKCFPKHERIGLVNLSDEVIINEFSNEGKPIQPGDPFIYDGPDRAALEAIIEEYGEDAKHIGEDFKSNPEFIQQTRNMGYNTVEDYLAAIGYDKKKETEKSEQFIKQETAHTPEVPHEESFIAGAGIDESGAADNDVCGGFGPERLRPASEVKKPRGRPKKR